MGKRRLVSAAMVAVALLSGHVASAAPLPAVSSMVRVESGADVLGAGFVLAGDQRVLTSLSSLGGRKTINVRYITGQVSSSSVILTDVGRDLALLDPVVKLPVGLKPASVVPASLLTLVRGKRELAKVAVKAPAVVAAAIGNALVPVLDLDAGADAPAPGAPLIDAAGEVAGMVISVCSAPADESCTPRTVGLGVDEIRQALKPKALPPTPAPPLTLQNAGGALPIRGLRVVSVPEWLSPYGIQKDDVIFAVRAETIIDAKQLEAIVTATEGRAGLLIFRAGRYIRLSGRAAPRKTSELPLEQEVVVVYGQRVESESVAAVRVNYTKPLARSAAGISSGDLLLVLDEKAAIVNPAGSRALVLRNGRLIELHLRRRVELNLAAPKN